MPASKSASVPESKAEPTAEELAAAQADADAKAQAEADKAEAERVATPATLGHLDEIKARLDKIDRIMENHQIH
jgi:hypothetical protein